MARFRERRWQVEGAERALPRSNLPTHQIPLESSSPFYISKLYAAKNRHLLRKNPSKAYRLPSVFFLEPVNFQHAPCHTRIVFTQPRLCEHNYRGHGAFSREEMAGGRCRAGFAPVKPSNAPDPSRKLVSILYL